MKKYKILFWVSTIILFLFEGMMPLSALLFDPQSATQGVVYLGYPLYFAYVLIAFKVLGSVLLIIPKLPRRLKEWTYAGFGFNFTCAMVSHLVIDGPSVVSFFPLVIFAILIVSYINYFKAFPVTKEA